MTHDVCAGNVRSANATLPLFARSDIEQSWTPVCRLEGFLQSQSCLQPSLREYLLDFGTP